MNSLSLQRMVPVMAFVLGLFAIILGARADDMRSADSLNVAGYFPVRAHVVWTPTVVDARVTNLWAAPMECTGAAYGNLYRGGTIHSKIWVNVWPGQTAYSFVYTNYSNPFIGAWAEVWCRFY